MNNSSSKSLPVYLSLVRSFSSYGWPVLRLTDLAANTSALVNTVFHLLDFENNKCLKFRQGSKRQTWRDQSARPHQYCPQPRPSATENPDNKIYCRGFVAFTQADMNAPDSRLAIICEKQIALLAARGLTNRQIATEIGLSINTVSNHLKRVYAKLEVCSRTELAWRLQYLDVNRDVPPDSRE
jgi:DNA-binding CsgD family transcriptional regulator